MPPVSDKNTTLAVTTQSNGTPVAPKDAASTLPVVAKVGDTSYTSLQEAINEAGPTDEIVLMEDVTLPSDTRYAKQLTINLNDKTLYLTNSVTFNADATVYNGTINADNKYAADGIIRLDYHVGTSVQVTLRDLTVSALNAEWSTGVFNLNSDDDTLILDNVDVIVSGRDDDPGSGVFYSPSSFNRGLVELKNDSTVTADNVNAVFFANDLRMDGAEISASNIHRPVFRQADGTVENSTITVDSPDDGVAFVADVASNNFCNVEFVNASISIPADMPVDGLTKDNSEMSIAGGTTSFDPTEWCDDNYIPIQNEDGSYGVYPDADTCYITATTTPADSGAVVTGTGLYALGQTVTLTATAPEGFRFVKWTENGVDVSTDPTISFSARNDRHFFAVFEQDPTEFWLWMYLAYMQKFTVNVSAAEGGTISPAGEPTATASDFTDVKAGEWYTAAIDWAAANKIVNGYEGKFDPEEAITREQFMAILHRFADFMKYESKAGVDGNHTTSEWAADDVAWANANGVLTGIETDISDMTAEANRAEIAAYLARFAKAFVK